MNLTRSPIRGIRDLMKTGTVVVGVRELKARLSAYLRVVAAGRVVLIGNRKKQPVAQLSPVAPSVAALHLHELEQRGILRRGRGRPGTRPPVKKQRARSVSRMALEDRR